MTLDELKAEILRLDPKGFAEMEDFFFSVAPDFRDDDEFDRELKRRVDEIESGKAVGIPLEEVMERLDRKYP